MEIYFQNRFLIFYSTFVLGCSKRYHFVAFLLTLSHFGTPFLMLQTQIEKRGNICRSPSGNFSGLILISDQISSSRCSFGSVIFVPLHFQNKNVIESQMHLDFQVAQTPAPFLNTCRYF
jgi:hypothetical protein